MRPWLWPALTLTPAKLLPPHQERPWLFSTHPLALPLTCMALADLHCGIFSGTEEVMDFLLLFIAGLPFSPFLMEV